MPPHGHLGLDTDRFCWTLVHDGPDAIVYADFGGLIRFWNRGAERIFGYSASEAVGSSLDIIIPENLRERHWTAYAETMRTGKTRYGDGDVLAVPALRKDGTRLSIEFTIFPYQDREGSLMGVGAILRDVTKRFEETKALRKEAAARQTSPPIIILKIRRFSGLDQCLANACSTRRASRMMRSSSVIPTRRHAGRHGSPGAGLRASSVRGAQRQSIR
jgi:PAS domain S-box-containing protein